MSHCIPFPAHAAASTAVAVSWAGRVESAYQWLCHARHTAHPNHPVWHFRWNWNTWKTRLLTHLKSAHPSYRLSPVRRVLTAAGERLECWEPQDSLMLKLLAEHLQPVLLPALSSHCHHLKGRGGIKRAVHHVRQTIETGDYPFVARSDAKGYYANIQHTRLLELLRVHCREAWVLDLASQYCGRTLEQDGYYRTVTKGISLGCPLSPLMGALYLSPLDEAMAALPGIRYTRFMDDWVILARSRWHLRRAVRVMNQVLAHLGLEQHPDKTFIGRVTRGFDFLGVDFQPGAPLAPSAVSLARKTEKIARLHEHLSSVALAKEAPVLRSLGEGGPVLRSLGEGGRCLARAHREISPTLAEVAAQPHRPADSRGLHPAGCHHAARHASAVPVPPFSPTAIHAGGACTENHTKI
jgi:hypothetical protein